MKNFTRLFMSFILQYPMLYLAVTGARASGIDNIFLGIILMLGCIVLYNIGIKIAEEPDQQDKGN